MTVPLQTPINIHAANGVTTVFAYQFKIVDADHLVVYADDAEITSGFTIAGVNDEDGGTVTFTTAPASGVIITLVRAVPAERTIFDYQNSGDFKASTVNADFDLIWQYLQQVASDLVSRAVLFGRSLDRSANTNEIPIPEPGKFITWSAGGDLLNASGTGADAGLRTDLAASTGSDLIMYGIRSLTSRLNDWRSVFNWGTSISAIQAAITESVAAKWNLHFPTYTYDISANLVVPATGNFHISGDGQGTIFAATAAVTKIFDLASGITNFSMSDLVLSGDGAAPVSAFNTTYGIYAPGMSHCHLSKVVVELCSTGIYARSGWSNYFEDVKAWYNGIGLDAGSSFNQCTLIHCKFWLNLYGAVLQGGFATAFYNCLFESNAKAGMVHNATSTLLSACYFEANCSVDVNQHPVGTVAGVVFTAPSQAVYADIILQGGGSEWKTGTMAIYAPSACPTIENCFTAPSVDEAGGGAFIYAIASKDLRVSGCSLSGDAVPMIKTYANSTYSNNQNITEFNNEGFSSILKLDNQTDGQTAIYHQIFKSSDAASKRNFAETDFLKWATIGAGAGAFQRKSIAGPNGVTIPVWSYVEASTAATIIKGFSITAENHPENIGKLFMFSLNVKATDAAVQITLRSKSSAAAFSAGNTDWQTISGTFIWPVSGSFSCFVLKSGNAGDLYVATPVLSEVGLNPLDVQAGFKNETVFKASAAPTTGEWVVGDVVLDSTPVSGAPMGWSCSAAPLTFVTMPNYA